LGNEGEGAGGTKDNKSKISRLRKGKAGFAFCSLKLPRRPPKDFLTERQRRIPLKRPTRLFKEKKERPSSPPACGGLGKGRQLSLSW